MTWVFALDDSFRDLFQEKKQQIVTLIREIKEMGEVAMQPRFWRFKTLGLSCFLL